MTGANRSIGAKSIRAISNMACMCTSVRYRLRDCDYTLCRWHANLVAMQSFLTVPL
jgi:hypothetical protein